MCVCRSIQCNENLCTSVISICRNITTEMILCYVNLVFLSYERFCKMFLLRVLQTLYILVDKLKYSIHPVSLVP